MTILQKILGFFYPLRMKLSSKTGLGVKRQFNPSGSAPTVSFYSLTAVLNNGEQVSFEQYKGKNVLLVNLASQCGYTGQYAELESLYKTYGAKLCVLGFPANDFGSQEPGSDEEIASFCQVNYGVSFPLFKKQPVKGAGKQPIYQWLSDPAQNGWNSQEPSWNFCKYLVSDKGVLLAFFSSAVSPLSAGITDRLISPATVVS